MPNFFILGFWGWDFVTNLSNGVIQQTDKAVNCKATSSWSPKLLFPFFFFLFLSHMLTISADILSCIEISVSQGGEILGFKSDRILLSLRTRKLGHLGVMVKKRLGEKSMSLLHSLSGICLYCRHYLSLFYFSIIL